MHKKILTLFLIALLPLTACGEVSSTVDASKIDEPVNLSFSESSYQIERGEYLTLKVNVDTSASGATRRVDFSIQQEGNVLSFVDEYVNSDGTIHILGKNTGKATLVATSVDNPTCSTSVEIEVIKHIPALDQVWKNINELSNYSILTTKTDELKNQTRSSMVQVTDDAILFEGFDYDEEEKSYYVTPLFTYDSAGDYVLGYGIDVNGYAFPIHMDTTGKLLSDSVISKTPRGFLTKDTFKGYGSEASNITEVGTFYGLQAINPDWLPKAKSIGNKYKIEYTESSLDTTAYVKYLLWGLIDPIGKLLATSDSISLVKAINQFDLSIEATSTNSITMDLAYKDGVYINGNVENYSYHAELTNVGTTEVFNIAGLEDFLKTFKASYPTLSPELQMFDDALGKHNYVFERELYWNNTGSEPYHATFYCYYTKDYMMAYFSPELIAAFNQANAGQEGFTPLTSIGRGILKKADGIHQFAYFPGDDPKLTVYELEQGTDANTEVWQCGFSNTKEGYIPNYFEMSNFYRNHGLNALSDVKTKVFEGLDEFYYTNNPTAFADFNSWFIDASIEGVDFLTGVNVTTKRVEDKTVLDKVNFLSAYSENKQSYYVIFTPELNHFGEAENQNPANELLQAEINP